MQARQVAILGYHGIAAINIAGPLEVLSSVTNTRERNGSHGYQVSIVGCTGNPVITDSRLAVAAQDLDSAAQAEWDTIIVAGGSGIHEVETCAKVVDAVKKLAPRAKRIASICSGIFALAPTGLLNGRRATTHWRYARQVADQFPELKVEESEIVVRDGHIYTAAGATAGIDLALTLVSEDFGHDTALAIARNLLVYLNRDGGQEQYAEPVDSFRSCSKPTQVNVGRMNELLRWITGNLDADLHIEVLAKRALLPRNTFVQEFTSYFGAPPGLFIKTLRFNEARRRLARGEAAPEIAKQLGFRDPNYFIQEFRRRFGALPDEYQRRFRGRRELNGAQPTLSSEASQSEDERQRGYTRPRLVSFTRCVRKHSKPA